MSRPCEHCIELSFQIKFLLIVVRLNFFLWSIYVTAFGLIKFLQILLNFIILYFFAFRSIRSTGHLHFRINQKLCIFRTVGRTLWTEDQPVARPLPTKGNTNAEKGQTYSKPSLTFESKIPAFERTKAFRVLLARSP
jgi:hypothetical protein